MLYQEDELIAKYGGSHCNPNREEVEQYWREACEEGQRILRTYEHQLADANAAIAEKETTIAEKEAMIAEKEAAIAEKEAMIAEKEAMIAEKRTAIAMLQAKLKELEK